VICDFGTSRIHDQSGSITAKKTRQAGTINWMSPDLLTDSYGFEVDVYSYGILLWEILYETTPYPKMNRQEILKKALLEGERPPIKDGTCPEPLKALIQDCWAKDPNKRPTFNQIVQRFSTFEVSFEMNQTKPQELIDLIEFIKGNCLDQNLIKNIVVKTPSNSLPPSHNKKSYSPNQKISNVEEILSSYSSTDTNKNKLLTSLIQCIKQNPSNVNRIFQHEIMQSFTQMKQNQYPQFCAFLEESVIAASKRELTIDFFPYVEIVIDHFESCPNHILKLFKCFSKKLNPNHQIFELILQNYSLFKETQHAISYLKVIKRLLKSQKISKLKSIILNHFLSDDRFEVVRLVYLMLRNLEIVYFSHILVDHIASEHYYIFALEYLHQTLQMEITNKLISNLTSRLKYHPYSVQLLLSLLTTEIWLSTFLNQIQPDWTLLEHSDSYFYTIINAINSKILTKYLEDSENLFNRFLKRMLTTINSFSNPNDLVGICNFISRVITTPELVKKISNTKLIFNLIFKIQNSKGGFDLILNKKLLYCLTKIGRIELFSDLITTIIEYISTLFNFLLEHLYPYLLNILIVLVDYSLARPQLSQYNFIPKIIKNKHRQQYQEYINYFQTKIN
jgi:hypothetical protein